MYLTQMKLNPSRDGTRRAMGSDQVMHAMVLSSFPHLQEGERVLWRTDVTSSHDVALYVVSPAKPDMTGLVEQAGWPLEATWRTASYAPVLGSLEAGQTWRFRLTANPTANVPQGPGVRGRVVPCITFPRQNEWMVKRAPAIGIDVGSTETPSFQISQRRLSDFSRHDKHNGVRGKVQLTKATYEGVLEVTDPVKLRQALVEGIGRGKAYGCGLLTLASP